MMDFFEALRKRAIKSLVRKGYEFEEIDAAIEALKEMMVGEPKKGTIDHHGGHTWIITTCPIYFRKQIIGTDHEGVVVMVFKVEEKD